MKKLLMIALAATTAATVSAPAAARQGCGIGAHRGPWGGCRLNRRPVVVAPGPVVVGTYYRGRGWWDGRRYWGHRRAYRGGWRYW